MPTAKGFTGQRADAATGLDYYGARYYDAVAGQFTSADTVASGRSPYAYVRGNPETLTDPTGHRLCNPNNPDQCAPPGGGGSGSGSGSGNGTSGQSPNTDPCQNPKSPACTDLKYKAWQFDANAARDKALRGKLLLAIAMIFTGDVAVAIGDWIVFRTATLWQEQYQAVADLITTLGTAFLALSKYIVTSGALRSILDGALTLTNALMAGLHAVAAAIDRGGIIAALAWDGAKEAIADSLGLEVSAATDVVGLLTGGMVGHLISAGGYALAAAGYSMLADYDAAEGESIDQWCQQNSGCPDKHSDTYGL